MQDLAGHIQGKTRALKKSRLPIHLGKQRQTLFLPWRIIQRDEKTVAQTFDLDEGVRLVHGRKE
jgi:hypothetical protein